MFPVALVKDAQRI